MNISIFYEKQDSYKVIRELTYHIGDVAAEIDEKNKNRQDIDIATFTYNDAKYIRKEIQINNEELYFLYIYITVYASNLKELNYTLNRIQGILQSRGIQSRIAYYRQEDAFLSTLPFMINSDKINHIARRNILSNGIIATYPFISSNIFDQNGIYFGDNRENNSLIVIDKYKEEYKNSNICIFGTSGSGKSYFSKLQIVRNRILGIDQYVIDPEREYDFICSQLDGVLLKIGPNSDTYLNVLEIRESSLEDGESGYLANKIQKLFGFFELIFRKFN